MSTDNLYIQILPPRILVAKHTHTHKQADAQETSLNTYLFLKNEIYSTG